MEDTLRVIRFLCGERTYTVLILVLMEDTLRVIRFLCGERTYTVLILVLMEDTLRGCCGYR